MLVHIQILRFLAAAAVVAFHVWGVAPDHIDVPADTPSLGLWHFGHGVDLFFVISGFIIYYATQASITRGKELSPSAFLRRRVERIVPLYAFAILAMTALAAALPGIFGTPGWYTPGHVLKSLAFVSFTDGQMPVVFVGWSLEYEMYFYLTLAALMVLTQNAWRAVVVAFCGLAIIGQIPGIADALGHYTFFTDPLILEFIFGVIAGILFVNGLNEDPDTRTMLLASACAALVLLVTDPANRALVYGLPSVALVAGAAWLSRLRTNVSRLERACERLGDASFSIYLIQAPLVVFAAQGVAMLFPAIQPHALVVLASMLVIAAGLALNIMVERPLLALCAASASLAQCDERETTTCSLRLPHDERRI
jgi:peptidoglycan/LPS O-acetylase OafA/YrhL